MSKWISVRHVALKEGENVEIDGDERIISGEIDMPYYYLVIVKESDRNPNSFPWPEDSM